MSNPYQPPADIHSQKANLVSAFNGFLLGLGLGLLSCDWIDLSPDNLVPLLGWRNGIAFCSLLGVAIGYFRQDSIACKLLVALGICHVSTGPTVAMTTFEGQPWNIYTTTLPVAGCVYILTGILAAFYKRQPKSRVTDGALHSEQDN